MNIDYRLARKRIELLGKILPLVYTSIKITEEVIKLLSMAFNYLRASHGILSKVAS